MTQTSNSETNRDTVWGSTTGQSDGKVIRAHKEPLIYLPFEGPPPNIPVNYHPLLVLAARLELEHATFSPSATFSDETNSRARNHFKGMKHEGVPLVGIDFRTRFERDRDAILHSEPYRRLAGKTQVHLNPDDHQRTRMTHAQEVAQIAEGMAKALRLNDPLAKAIGLGHDCGHGPGGHASEDALDPYLPGGFNHAIFGADVTLRSLDLCSETLDGIRNHSWSLNTPKTPEGELVSFADRIAYVCHDLEDALSCKMISRRDFPAELAGFMNRSRGEQIDAFIRAVIQGSYESGTIAIVKEFGEILMAMRKFNNERIYKHPDSIEQNKNVIETLSQLVDHLIEHPELLPDSYQRDDNSIVGVVEYVAGMTDDYAYRLHAQYVKQEPISTSSALYLM